MVFCLLVRSFSISMFARWMVAINPSVWSLPVLSLMVTDQCQQDMHIARGDVLLQSLGKIFLELLARLALNQFPGGVAVALFWHAAFIAGMITLSSAWRSEPTLRTIAGASAGR